MVSQDKLHRGMLLTGQVIFKAALYFKIKLSLNLKIPFFIRNLRLIVFNSRFLKFIV